ncbi:tyrosine-protein phosphatase non-receptor type substrate 1-like [Liasis olivaceus]
MAALRSFLGIPGLLQLLFLLLLQDLVVGGQNVKITQHPESLSVTAGETLSLTCTLTGENPPGGVRWYKGQDRSQPPIFSDKEGASNRGVRVVPESNTDFNISIRNILPEDAGTYYCVKFRAGNPETEVASGKGTVVSVIATRRLSSSGLWIGIVMAKIGAVFILLCFFLRKENDRVDQRQTTA